MPIAVRDCHAPHPALAPLAGMEVRAESSAHLMASLQNKIVDEMRRRFESGHRAYVAWRAGEPAAWGWVATRSAHIGELDSTFTVPVTQRSLSVFLPCTMCSRNAGAARSSLRLRSPRATPVRARAITSAWRRDVGTDSGVGP